MATHAIDLGTGRRLICRTVQSSTPRGTRTLSYALGVVTETQDGVVVRHPATGKRVGTVTAGADGWTAMSASDCPIAQGQKFVTAVTILTGVTAYRPDVSLGNLLG